MRSIHGIAVFTTALTLQLAAAAGASAQDFSWRGTIANGRTFELKNINGEVEAVAASGNEIRVTAQKRDNGRGDPEDVRIEVIEHDGGVTICAVYPTPRNQRQDNECVPGRGGRMNTKDNNVTVDFRVEIPRGVNAVLKSVNGGVEANGLSGDVEVATVNGDVEATSNDGLVRASTVNGSIDVSMGRSNWTGELEFETVNGSITVALPGELHSEVHASTVNGSISTDWPLTIRGRFGPKRLSGTVGNGGRTLSLSTVNGSIELVRR